MNAASFELQVLSYAGGEAAPGLSVRLGHSPVSVGRSPACHLSLDDPERLISRSHLSVWVDAHGAVWLRNASSSTPVFIDGIELPPAGQSRLQPGQSIVLGRYLLGLQSAASAASARPVAAAIGASQASPWPVQQSAAAAIPEEFDVFAPPLLSPTASGGRVASCDLSEFSDESRALADVFEGLQPFDARGPAPTGNVMDLLGAGDARVQSAVPDPLERLLGGGDALLRESSPVAATRTANADQNSEIDALFRLPSAAVSADHAGLMSPAASIPSTVGPSPAASGLDILELDLGVAGAGSVGFGVLDLISATGSTAAPAATRQAESLRPAVAVPASTPTPGGAEIGPERPAPFSPAAPRAAPAPATASVPNAFPAGLDVSALSAEALAGSVAAPRARVAVAPPPLAAADASDATQVAPSAPYPSSTAVLAEAFARGCGLSVTQVGAFDDAAAENLGQLFRSLVAGALQLIHARSSTKHELRAQMTIIATSGNNPLKFAPDVQAAMLQLVGRGLPGFMPPVEAVRDAFADLSAHQVGLLAASRAAMYAMAGRLSPEHIQQRVGGPRGFSGLLPSAHKAQLWDAFVAEHAKLLGEAREEFDAAFQGAFVDAYEGEVRRVQTVGSP
ncbi:MAG: type VI secretion system-associated FHA domain protein TagH [Aquimonas sp.]